MPVYMYVCMYVCMCVCEGCECVHCSLQNVMLWQGCSAPWVRDSAPHHERPPNCCIDPGLSLTVSTTHRPRGNSQDPCELHTAPRLHPTAPPLTSPHLISSRGRPRSARTSSRLSRRPSAPTPMQSLRPPGVHKQGPGVIWHHQSSREPPTKVYHRGSIFGMPTHMRGSHFTIHPEWPEYYPVADT